MTNSNKRMQLTPEQRQKKIRKRILIAAIAVLAVIVALIVVYNAMFRRPDVEEQVDPVPTDTMLDLTGMQPKAGGKRRTEDFYTFLVMGRDTGGGGNTDTLLLVSYNVTDQQLSVMSLPRDIMVNVPWDIKKLNTVYNFYGGGEKGLTAVKEEVADLVGFVPDYEVIVEWEAVGELVEAIGGVWFDVPFDMDYEDPTQDLSIHLKKGYQQLSGEQAMGLIRWRHNNSYSVQYPNGDLGRIQTQQEFLKAVIKEALQVKNAAKIMEFSEIFSDNVTTDLSVQNLFWLGKAAILGGLDMENVRFVTMPYEGKAVWSRSVKNYQSYVVPKAAELLELINTHFNPFEHEVSLNEVDLMGVNRDGTLTSTSGKVEDTKATPKPEEPVEETPAQPPDLPPQETETEPVTPPPTETGSIELPPESLPVETTPVETIPIETTPVEETLPPVETMPLETMPASDTEPVTME